MFVAIHQGSCFDPYKFPLDDSSLIWRVFLDKDCAILIQNGGGFVGFVREECVGSFVLSFFLFFSCFRVFFRAFVFRRE